MLHIKCQLGQIVKWRIGEPLPMLNGSVITFQADGDELEIIENALRKHAGIYEVASLNLLDAAQWFYDRNDKIGFIKEIRRRFQGSNERMGLVDAKMMADGFWSRFKYEKVNSIRT